MGKCLRAWLESVEKVDAKLRDQGYTINYGPDVSYLTPLPQSKVPAGRGVESSMLAGLWTKSRMHRPSRSE